MTEEQLQAAKEEGMVSKEDFDKLSAEQAGTKKELDETKMTVFTEEYLDVGLKKKEENDPKYVPWKEDEKVEQERQEPLLVVLERIAEALEGIKYEILRK